MIQIVLMSFHRKSINLVKKEIMLSQGQRRENEDAVAVLHYKVKDDLDK